MPDEERRHDDRRSEDVRLAEAVSELQLHLDERFALEWEKADKVHDGFATKESQAHLEQAITRLVAVLEGEQRIMPSGTVTRTGGLISEVENLTKKLSNGGIKIKIPPPVWAAVVVAIITGLFNVWAAMSQVGVAP